MQLLYKTVKDETVRMKNIHFPFNNPRIVKKQFNSTFNFKNEKKKKTKTKKNDEIRKCDEPRNATEVLL